ncbi:MAG: glucokinase [Erysipelotrichaceae bacterium]|nr:MAG: hypothetical protein FD179_740 [Erysipelotrichaceae bacterium]TXT18414.1 MAG: glucokinase [Erysipelotrichaceae bacterium]
MDQYLVLDVGGTYIKYALMTPDLIIEKGEVLTPLDNSEHLIDTLTQIYKKYENIAGFALSVPGRIDIHKGIMHTGGNLSYIKDFPLKEILSKHCSVKISMENDGKCAALGEAWKGSLQGVQQGLAIVLGTGIGGGIIVNGQLLRGHTYAAGELSLIPLSVVDIGTEEPFLWAHMCGTMGLTEVYEKEKNLPHESMNGRQFFDLANAKDETALKVLAQFARSFALGVMGVQAVLDTQVITVGGGISAQPLLIESLQKAVDVLYDQYKKMPISKPKIIRCAFGNDSNLYGALYHHLYE